MARWRDVVAARLADGALRCAVDVGAGTGLFLDLWHELGATAVVAVEPSVAMRQEAADGAPAGTAIVAGTADAIPLRDGAADVVWMSAVIHHVPDLAACVGEVRRVLRPGGRFLVRGWFPDTSVLAWLDHLPGADPARDRFPTTTRLTDALVAGGLSVDDVANVVDGDPVPAEVAADWIDSMRHTDSLLTAVADHDLDDGIEALRDLGAEPLAATELTLITATRI
jgi:SAM-dependent methyltransferase